MKSSRIDGKLIIKTRKPYRIAVNGELQDRYGIECRDVTTRAEPAAANLEQFIATAITATLSDSPVNTDAPEATERAEEIKSFSQTESPTLEEVDQAASELMNVVNISGGSVKAGDIYQHFDGILNARLIRSDTGDPILKGGVWESIHRKDKLRLMYSYISFFGGLFDSASEISKGPTEESDMSEDPIG